MGYWVETSEGMRVCGPKLKELIQGNDTQVADIRGADIFKTECALVEALRAKGGPMDADSFKQKLKSLNTAAHIENHIRSFPTLLWRDGPRRHMTSYTLDDKYGGSVVTDEPEKIWANFANSREFSIPEEVEGTEGIYEGALRRISINAYERNPEARHKCIAHYGTSCSVCGFNFGSVYGEVGKDLIHVHHLRQLAEIAKEYQIDPIRDLRPVCPNCHAIIHRRKPAYRIEEVQALLCEAKQH